MTLPPLAALRAPLILLLTVLIAAVAGVVWSLQLDARALASVESQRAALSAAQTRQRQGQHEARMIDAHIDAYRALVARGFIGEENRLAWIEAVQLANRDAGLYGLSYRLMPRAASPPSLAQGLPLGQTRMTLTFPLLVETDLPRFLDALKARASGVYHVQGCRLSRPDNTPFEAVNRPHLQAECDLLWFTVTTTTENHHE